MRILFCNYEYPPLGGGGGVINALLAEELARSHEVSVLTSQGLGTPRSETVNGVSVERVPVFFRNRFATANMASMGAYMIKGRAAGLRLLREKQFDVINTHFALPTGPVGAFLAAKSEIPNVLTLLGGDVYDPSKLSSPHRHALLRGWVRRIARSANRVVADSNDIRDRFHQYFDNSVDVDVIPLGINRVPSGSAIDLASYGIDPGDIVLITVGRLVRRKAIDQLIEILRDLGNPAVKLIVVGSGPLDEKLRSKAADLGVINQVVFAGFVDENTKFALLRSADVFVSASQHEGFGLVFLEAMACGLPVACYDRGGQTDFIESGANGFLMPLNDVSKFRHDLGLLCEDVHMRQRMARANLQKVEDYFIDTCAARYLEVFESVTA